MSTVTPKMLAKKRMPLKVIMLAAILSPVEMTPACVPGSAMKVQACQMLSRMGHTWLSSLGSSSSSLPVHTNQ
eukprot:CAMPEP_0115474204 /NCGR_PEP_ID=MMETSP0271-20121206/53973_1 /TAXON_ID=71861 /ORGANISM="Scrippsiella trochoidea, Strain CCMP3099" /LENGTH=72 /DNA_ID=CAMNT_0002901523 /DNA_START=25 /DNA_END=243 /DNA_ORIENTATION=-